MCEIYEHDIKNLTKCAIYFPHFSLCSAPNEIRMCTELDLNAECEKKLKILLTILIGIIFLMLRQPSKAELLNNLWNLHTFPAHNVNDDLHDFACCFFLLLWKVIVCWWIFNSIANQAFVRGTFSWLQVSAWRHNIEITPPPKTEQSQSREKVSHFFPRHRRSWGKICKFLILQQLQVSRFLWRRFW